MNQTNIEVNRQGEVLSHTERSAAELNFMSKKAVKTADRNPFQYPDSRNCTIENNVDPVEMKSDDILDELNKNLIQFKKSGLALQDELVAQNK
ncbi:hypothetical protein MXB_4360, partial [Myxobolus squamalis]